MTAPALAVQDVVRLAQSRGGTVKKAGDDYIAKCPAHDDNNASLSIGAGKDGKVLLHCHAGCTFDAIASAYGVAEQQLFPAKLEDRHAYSPIEKEYDYVDADGKLLYQVVRKYPKGFSQRQPNGKGGWEWKSVAPESRVLYRVPEIIEAVALGKTVYITEGEKDADTLANLGATATTNSGGAGKWLAHYSETLRDATVVVLPDNDDAGKEHARVVEKSLSGVAQSVRILELPGLAQKGDVSEWFANGGTIEKLRELETAAEQPEQQKDARVFLSLRDLLERPELLLPPPVVIPRIGYEGRTTILAGPDKSGKSTLLAHAVAQLTRRGQFFGEPVSATTARVIWVGLEEALGDAVRRFHELGANPDNIQLVVSQPTGLLEHIRALLNEWSADLLVIDSLTEYARVVRGTVPEDGDTSGWAGVIRPVVALTREFSSLSSVLSHHTRRSDGQYRSSSEIAAAVDCMLEMRTPKENEDRNVRHITGRGRWTVPDFDVRFTGSNYELAGSAPLSVDARILLHVTQNPGISGASLRSKVGGRAKDVDAALAELTRRNAILDIPSGKGHGYHLAASVQQPALELAS